MTWFEPSGQEMTDEAWDSGFVRCLGVRLAGDTIEEMDERGQRIVGDTLLILFNAHHEMIPFTVPEPPPERPWEFVLDTSEPGEEHRYAPWGKVYELQGRSVVALRIKPEEEAQEAR